MKHLKKTAIATLTLMATLALTACSNETPETLATMKGQQITTQTLYEKTKATSSMHDMFRQIIISEAFTSLYGDKVTDEVDKTFNEAKDAYPDKKDFDKMLADSGLTEMQFKETLRQNLAVDYGLRENIELTDKEIDEAFKNYTPESKIEIISFDDEKLAKEFLEATKKNKDFLALAKEHTTEPIAMSVDSGDTVIPMEVHAALTSMKNGDVSTIIPTVDETTYMQKHYVVKLVEKGKKEKDKTKYQDRLKDIVINEKLNHTANVNLVIGKVLSKANVKITDPEMAQILSPYLSPTDDELNEDTSETSTTEP